MDKRSESFNTDIKSSAAITRGRNGRFVATTENNSIVFFFASELLIIASLLTLNYFLRFQPDVRWNCDMTNFDDILLSCDATKIFYEWSRPYYSGYTKANDEDINQLNYGMDEWVFFLCCFLVPISMVILVEIYTGVFPKHRYKEVRVFGRIIPQAIRRIFRITGGFLLGMSLCGLFVCVLKFNLVAPRPHFMSVCLGQPAANISLHFCPNGVYFWNPKQECSPNVPYEDLLEAMKSYPSYHAAIAVFCGVFASAYISSIAFIKGLYSFPLVVTFSLLIMTALGATHRLATFHAFPQDIYIGAIIGAITALILMRVTLNNFEERLWKLRAKIRKENKKTTKISQDPPSKLEYEVKTDSDSDVDQINPDYLRISSSIDTFPLIPRVVPEASENIKIITSTTQAFNSNVNIDKGTTIAMAQKQDQTYHNPLMSQKIENTETRIDTYNVPRQRSSAPTETTSKGETSASSFFYHASDRKTDGPFLSAYLPSEKNPKTPFSF